MRGDGRHQVLEGAPLRRGADGRHLPSRTGPLDLGHDLRGVASATGQRVARQFWPVVSSTRRQKALSTSSKVWPVNEFTVKTI